MSRRARIVLPIVFLLSGAVSLVYEVVWARLLAVHLGSTTEGHTVVNAPRAGHAPGSPGPASRCFSPP